MSKNTEFVKFDKVDKSYDGKVLVVKDLNLNISEGEFITMLGPSGSGKTTCLMMLAGFETPTNGEIYLDSNPISNIPPHKRGIGMVFQNYALFPHMTVFENLAFPLRVRKIEKDEIEKKVDKALSMVSLSGFESRMPAQLSGGQLPRGPLVNCMRLRFCWPHCWQSLASPHHPGITPELLCLNARAELQLGATPAEPQDRPPMAFVPIQRWRVILRHFAMPDEAERQTSLQAAPRRARQGHCSASSRPMAPPGLLPPACCALARRAASTPLDPSCDPQKPASGDTPT